MLYNIQNAFCQEKKWQYKKKSVTLTHEFEK